MKNFYKKIKEVFKIPCFYWNIFLLAMYIISLSLKNIPFLNYFQYILGPTIALLYPGLLISYFFSFKSADALKKFVFSISVSILLQPAFSYILDRYFNVSINLTNLLTLNLSFFFLFFISLLFTPNNKIRNEDKPTDKKELLFLLSGYTFICFVYILHIHATPFIPFGDPYTFKSITDYIMQNGHYPNGFIPATFPAYFWNYEPFYQTYLTIITILGGFSSFYAYKYVGMLITNLIIFPLYLIIKKILNENINVKKITPLLALTILSVPILFLETKTIRPQTIIFYFSAIILLLLLEYINLKYLFIIITILIIFLSKFHIFYIIFIPIFLLISLFKFYESFLLSLSRKFKTILFFFIPLFTLVIYVIFPLIKFSTRLQWVLSIFNINNLKLTFSNLIPITALPYNLGIFIIISPFLFLHALYKKNITIKKSSIFILLFMIIEFFILVVIPPIIGFDFISDRFFPFLGIVLVIPSVCGAYYILNNKKFAYIFIISMLLISFILTFNITHYGYGQWTTPSEFASLEKASALIKPNSIAITQNNNTPLIRSVFNNSLFIYQLTDTENKLIFLGNTGDEKITELRELCDYSFSNRVQKIKKIKNDYDNLKISIDKSTDKKQNAKLRTSFLKLSKQENEIIRSTPFLTTHIKDTKENKPPNNADIEELIATKDFEKQSSYIRELWQRSNNKIFSSMYIIYSKEKDRSSNNIAQWWREASFDGANIDFFNSDKENFDTIYSDNTMDVWEFKGCKKLK